MDPSNKLQSLILSMVAFVLVADAALKHGKKLSKEENLELEKQLKAINKPAIKSFRTAHGDILDCIDIHKQLAFDHPLLKNHSLQLRPKTIPEWITKKNASNKLFLQHDINCPQGTVIVKRTTKQDLLLAQHLQSLRFNHPRNSSSEGDGVDLRGHHYAAAVYSLQNYGIKGDINIWDLEVLPDQFSLSSMTIGTGTNEQLNSLQAGWIVYNLLYPDHVRLFTYWTADGYNNTGCYNILCPGFVQVSTKLPVGSVIQPVSTYGGPQYALFVSLYQDRNTGDWWFAAGDEYIGYWPKSLFKDSGLAKEAWFATWGGEVYSPLTEKSPKMGSGHFPKEGFKKSAYVNEIKVVESNEQAYSPAILTLKKVVDSPNCYKAKVVAGYGDPWTRAVFFGGPGGC